jgi:hypothetical protein
MYRTTTMDSTNTTDVDMQMSEGGFEHDKMLEELIRVSRILWVNRWIQTAMRMKTTLRS